MQAIARAGTRQVTVQRIGVAIGDVQVVDVEHRVAQSRTHERIADIVHVGKYADMAIIIDRSPGFTEFR